MRYAFPFAVLEASFCALLTSPNLSPLTAFVRDKFESCQKKIPIRRPVFSFGGRYKIRTYHLHNVNVAL